MDNTASCILQGAFCSSLRDRPLWKMIGPLLTLPGTKLEERQLHGCDFTLRLESSPERLNIILLSPVSLDTTQNQDTISRLVQFHTSHSNTAVALLLSDGPFSSASGKGPLHALLDLQVMIVGCLPTLIPIIPVSVCSSLLPCMQNYMRSFTRIPPPITSATDCLSLLSHIPLRRNLSPYEKNILSDLFPSLKALGLAARTYQGQALFGDYLGEERARDLIQFWATDTKSEMYYSEVIQRGKD